MSERPEDRPDWPERLEELGRFHSPGLLGALVREAQRSLELHDEVERLRFVLDQCFCGRSDCEDVFDHCVGCGSGL